ncbi:peptidase M19 [Parvularcula flava]|uniref:Dipeptidase n=1 Tax=Aquisalinus luteolus TaxID=1566827 RepID=A0A8J3ERM1_9PROT|nr:membrane dipeptidase [Aquisalinus luteolus]NHK28748.1 peptidase M19 [Aquisalinus luteolus]GGH99401.1 dipeptidase [Aquisalinus luteolus]
MKLLLKLLGGLAVVLILIALVVYWFVLPVVATNADRDMNPVVAHEPYDIAPEAAALHETLNVADLHADTLLWMRDPAQRHDYGQTDLPRLREGEVALQVFSTVTKSPSGLNYETNEASSDDITILAIGQHWPMRTWGSIYERAAYQAHRLQEVEREDENFLIIRTRSDLAAMLAARQDNKAVMGGLLAMEGAHPLEGELANVDRLFDEGFRMMGLQHFFDNELGGSLHGISNDGLTEFGQAAVARALELGMVIDVAHSSPAVVEDVLAMTDAPLVVSHTGIKSYCETKRNIPDELMARIAEGGGLIGIGYWEDVTCDASPLGIANVIFYAAEKFGVDHVALGSDFDGTVTTELDTSELAAITDRLLYLGMSTDDIRKVMGENVLRYLSENLPE